MKQAATNRRLAVSCAVAVSLSASTMLAACNGQSARETSSPGLTSGSSSSQASNGPNPARDKATAGLPSQSELDAARRDVAKLSVQDLAGQVIVANYDGTDPSQAAAVVRQHHLGGVVVMGDNVPAQVTTNMPKITDAVQQAMRSSGRSWPAAVATDQEGGPVARFKAPVTPFPAGMAYGAANNPSIAEAATEAQGEELRSLGINMVFAPDADVTVGAADTTIGVRSPGQDPARVSTAVNAEVAGFQKSGLVPVIKHFPGHGSVTTDTHRAVATQTQSVAQLMKRDWVPFAGAVKAGVPAIMSAHIVVSAVDSHVPGTLSPKVLTGQLRDKLGFKGLIVTDAMNMGAIANTFDSGGAAAVSALNAGADVILMPRDVNASITAITHAVAAGKLPKDRLVDAAAHLVATMRHQQVRRPSTSVVGSHTKQADDLARASITQLGGQCGKPLVGRLVTLVGGTATERAGMTSAIAKRGVRVGAGGTPVSLISPGAYNAGLASAAGGSAAKSAAQGGGSGGTARVQIALDVPYALAQRPKGAVGLAAYGQTPATFTALADVLTGARKATGTLPVTVGSDRLGSSACHR